MSDEVKKVLERHPYAIIIARAFDKNGKKLDTVEGMARMTVLVTEGSKLIHEEQIRADEKGSD